MRRLVVAMAVLGLLAACAGRPATVVAGYTPTSVGIELPDEPISGAAGWRSIRAPMGRPGHWPRGPRQAV